MTTLERGLHGFLSGKSAITNLVGARIYPVILPQDPTYPALSYHRVSGVRLQALAGAADWDTARITINAWASTYAGAKALAEAVRGALNGHRGTFSSTDSPAQTVTVGAARLENEIDLFETDAGTGGSRGIHRVMADYKITHRET